MDFLQQEITDKIKTLPNESLEFLPMLIENYMEPASKINNSPKRTIGIYKGQDLYDPDYDFDEMNDGIAELFGA